MSISRDPDKFPEVTAELRKAAKATGKIIINVICDVPQHDADSIAVQFNTLVSSIPRIGEWIGLEDGTSCEVLNVCHHVRRIGEKSTGETVLSLQPQVYAMKLQSRPERKPKGK